MMNITFGFSASFGIVELQPVIKLDAKRATDNDNTSDFISGYVLDN
jgi:hypothetical protein